MKRLTQALIAVFVVVCAIVVYAQAPSAKGVRPEKPANDKKEVKGDDLTAFMRLKLDHTQKVLEGLALEDFKLIAHHSSKMALLVEDENWMVSETPEYKHHRADFQTIANRLAKAAREENLDAATLAYVDLTMSCVNCHKYTRGNRLASRVDPTR